MKEEMVGRSDRLPPSHCIAFAAALLMWCGACEAEPSKAPLHTTRRATSVVVPVGTVVGGTTREDWSRACWKWAGSFDRDDSPVADPTGALCDRQQSGPVWFLAGTFGSKRTIRSCHVPAGKHLFFPLINDVVVPNTGQQLSCREAIDSAARITDPVVGLFLEVDGRRVPELLEHRLATRDCFHLRPVADATDRLFPAAANGYYVMLRPLKPGRHTLNFGGALPSLLQGVTYTLVVE